MISNAQPNGKLNVHTHDTHMYADILKSEFIGPKPNICTAPKTNA